MLKEIVQGPKTPAWQVCVAIFTPAMAAQMASGHVRAEAQSAMSAGSRIGLLLPGD